MSEISSGLVAVAWQVRNGWSSCDLYRTLKSATEDRDMLQKRADFAGNLMAYRVEPLVRLSDAEAKLSECVTSYEKEVAGLTEELDAKDAEIEAARRSSDYWKANHLAGNQVIEKQSAALKLARQALTSITEKPRAYEGIRMASQALAAIDALKGE